MDPNALREHLETLHEELAAAGEVDPRSKQLLGEIMQDIQRLMERSPASASSAGDAAPVSGLAPESALAPDAAGLAADDGSLPERLERIAVQFEVDHPTPAASSRR